MFLAAIHRIFAVVSVIFFLCTVFNCQNPLTDDNNTTYVLTIQTDGHGAIRNYSNPLSVAKGTKITIEAVPDDMYTFGEWTVVSGTGVLFEDSRTATTTVALNGGNAIIKANFIPTGIMVTSPNGGELLRPGNTYSITWKSTEYTDTVKIELLKAHILTLTIAVNTENDGVYQWIVPINQGQGNDYSIRISSLSNTNWSDDSNGAFSIGVIRLESPNGGETAAKGGDLLITWFGNNTGLVKLELLKEGAQYDVITASSPNDGSFDWQNISCTGGLDYKIRISVLGTDSTDESDACFGVVDGISIAIPTGAEVWEAGVLHDIFWSSTGGGFVKIELLKGGSLSSTIATSTENDGSYSWTIPVDQPPGKDYRLLVTTITTPAFVDTNDADFSIENITVTSPDGNEVFAPGGNPTITWTSSTFGNVQIELYKGGSFSVTIAASTENDGSFVWSIPANQALWKDYKIRITHLSDTQIWDESNGEFSIEKISVTFPNGNEVFAPGGNPTITWTSSTFGNVQIELYKGGSFSVTIAASTENDGSFVWSIPANQALGKYYKIRITHLSDTQIWDESNGEFSIEKISVTFPNGNEVLEQGGNPTITWTSSTFGNVKIELYKGGSFSATLAASTENDGSFVWSITVGRALGMDYSVRITDLSNTQIWGESSGDFVIEKITVVSPNNGEAFGRQRAYAIMWSSVGYGNVKIELYKGGSFNSSIIANTANSGTYIWTVSGSQAIGSDYKIKISNLGNIAIADESDQYFSIEQIAEVLSNLPSNPADTNSLDVSVGGTHIVSYKYKIDGGSWSAETNTATHITISDLTLGSHSLYVIGKDEQGSWPLEANASVFNWTIDIASPTVILSNLRNNGIVQSGFVIGTASDDYQVNLVEVKLDSGSYQPASGATNWKLQLPTGSSTWKENSQHTVTVRARDFYGHYSTVVTVTVRKGVYKDVNGDGYADVIVGAFGYNSNQGCVYVFHSLGSPGIPNNTADAANIKITGEAGSSFGYAVALGDVNGDGYADAVVGAYDYNSTYGRVYIYYSAGPSGIAISNARIINGVEYSNFGCSLALGDINGDGYSDVIAGAHSYNSSQGRAYVFHSSGSSGIQITNASNATRIITGEETYDGFGYCVALGDVNNDGYADALVGGPVADFNYGRAYVFHSTGAAGISITSAVSATSKISGEAAGSLFGHSVALGDVNGDGYVDALIGSDTYSDDQGRAYVFHSSGYQGITITSASSASRIITGEAGVRTHFGWSVALGDINGDGFSDALVGGDGYNAYQGRAYVFHSSGTGGITIDSVSSASSMITGETRSDFMYSAALADVNGDGYSDVIVGAYYYNNSQGCAYVFHSSGTTGITITSTSSASTTITGEPGTSQFGACIALSGVINDVWKVVF